MRRTLISLAALALSLAAHGQSPYGAAELRDTTAAGVVTEIAFYSPDKVNVRKFRAGTDIPRQQLVVTMAKQEVAVTQAEQNGVVTLTTDSLQVRYAKTGGTVRFLTRAGSTLLAEKTGGTALTARKDGQFDSFKVSADFSIAATEQLYGLGQLQNGAFSQRGQTYNYMIEGNTSVFIPYFYSSRGYSVFWNNASPTTFREADGTLHLESAVGYGVDYFFLAGRGERSVAAMRALSGQVPMIPLWAYGYFQSKERYQSADETMGVVKKYRDLAVPIDCVVQDWQYWGGNNQWNALEFLNPTFANYQQMLDSVHAMDSHIIISTWANFGPDTKPYAYLKAHNMLMLQGGKVMTSTYPGDAGVAIYDPYNALARDFYWKTYYDNIISKGMDGYWLDSSEPDHYQGGSEMEETFDFVTGLGCTWRAVRNAFPLMHVGGIYDHHRAEPALAGKRVTILTRSSYAGLQRTGANTWSGDVTASWETLRKQVPAALNFSVCGNPNWNSDIGAFFIGDYGGVGNDSYKQLYTRWFQFGTFCTMMRSHGAGIDKAIYRFGEAGTPWYDRIDTWINFRYHLLPYIYTTAADIHRSGLSMMNALPIAFPDDSRALTQGTEFMFGRSLLVAPVIEKDATRRSVYLPQGRWTDFWDGTQTDGRRTVSRDVTLDMIPLYVPAGTILPYAYNVQSTRELQRADSMQIRVYPGADGRFELYEDEGDNYNYERGASATIPFGYDDATRTLTIGARQGAFEGMHQRRTFDIVLVTPQRGTGIALSDTLTARVRYDGSPVTVDLSRDSALAITIADAQPVAVEDNTEPYAFHATDWQTGDENRVSSANVRVNRARNTITVAAGTGDNNTALSLARTAWDKYRIAAGHTWFCVTGTNLQADPARHAVWYMNGQHVGTVTAKRVLDRADGRRVVCFDLTDRLPTYASFRLEGSDPFAVCFGLTATAAQSVISDIGFYGEDQLDQVATALSSVTADAAAPVRYYTLAGTATPRLLPGINLAMSADGTTRKVLVR